MAMCMEENNDVAKAPMFSMLIFMLFSEISNLSKNVYDAFSTQNPEVIYTPTGTLRRQTIETTRQ